MAAPELQGLSRALCSRRLDWDLKDEVGCVEISLNFPHDCVLLVVKTWALFPTALIGSWTLSPSSGALAGGESQVGVSVINDRSTYAFASVGGVPSIPKNTLRNMCRCTCVQKPHVEVLGLPCFDAHGWKPSALRAYNGE